MTVEQLALEVVGRRRQITVEEQRNLGGKALFRIENLDENWGDDGITSDAARVYAIGPGSIPRDVVPISLNSDSSWNGFHR